MNSKRKPLVYFIFLMTTIGMGLFSRAEFIPKFIYPYLGDIFYALMIFFILGLLFPRITSLKLAFATIGICFLVELSQLYQAHWINAIRNLRLGGLLLGNGFLWSDLVSYSMGGFLGFTIEILLVNKYANTSNN